MRLRSILPLLATLCCLTATAQHHQQKAQARPKLVVAIVVEQLRTDYVEYLSPLMSSEGFRKLKGEGAYLRDVEFTPAHMDLASATAMIFTGATPNETGISAAEVWDPASLREVPALSDKNTLGVNSALTISPQPLLLSTVADELMIDGAGLSMIQAVAADPQQAVIMAGHSGNGASWLSTTDGRWATSSYYKELPQTAANRNFRMPLSARVDTMQWKPLLSIDRYPGLPAQKRQYDFRHTFPSRAKEVYEQFAASPRGNEEVTSMAIDMIKGLNMGRRGDTIDMLCLGYTLAPFRWVKDGDYRLELQDAYLRLDLQLERLLKSIDQSVGLANCVIMLTGTGYYNDAVPTDAKYRIPSGDFSTKRAIALLNGFFSAKYGPGNYVDSFTGGGFHLALKVLESKGVNPADAARDAKEFLMKMSGVRSVYTLSEILSPDDEETRRLYLSTDSRTAPQLTIELTPGWNLVEDHTFPIVTTPIRRGAISTPGFFFAPGRVSRADISTPVCATALAPTLTSLLHLRAPNGAASRPISLPQP